MAGTASSYSQFISKNAEALHALGYTPERSLEDYDLPARKGRSTAERIQELLREREEIAHISSTLNQREAYGIDRWNADFRYLSHCEPPDTCTLSREQFRAQIWKALPHSRFKRFQEAFSDPEHLIVPPFSVIRNRIQFDPKVKAVLRDQSVQGCLVRGDRLSDELVEGLKLVSLELYRGDPLARLTAKSALPVIQTVKQIWDSCALMQNGNLRVLRIETASEENRRRYPDALPLAPELRGTLLYSRENMSGEIATRFREVSGRALTVQHFCSAYSARRKTDIESSLYESELRQLAGIRNTLADRNLALGNWGRAPSREVKDDLKKLTQSELLRPASLLSGCIEPSKVRARELLKEGSTFTDRRGRENVSGTMSKITGAQNSLSHRNEVIPHKGSRNYQDAAGLKSLIDQGEERVEKLCLDIEKAAGYISSHQLVGTSALNRAQIIADVEDVLIRTELYPHRIVPMLTMPLRAVGEAWAVEMTNFSLQLRCRSEQPDITDQLIFRAAIERSLVRMEAIGKFAHALIGIEHLKDTLTNQPDCTFSHLHEAALLIERQFGDWRVFPMRAVPEMNVPVAELESLLSRMQRRLSFYAEHGVVSSERGEVNGRMKAFLDSIEIPRMIRMINAGRTACPA